MNAEDLIGFYSSNRFEDLSYESYYNDDRSFYVVCRLGKADPPRGPDRLKFLLLRGLPVDHQRDCCRMICYQKTSNPCLVSGNRKVFDQFSLHYRGLANDLSPAHGK